MQRWISAILAGYSAINDAFCQFHVVEQCAERARYRPFQPSLCSGCGSAFLVSGLALGMRAWRPAYWHVGVAGPDFSRHTP